MTMTTSARILAEADAREFLAQRIPNSVPFIDSIWAATPGDAVEAARELGGTVSIKGHVPGAAHKANLGLVALDLRSIAEVEEACRVMIATYREDDFGGFLVQRHARGGQDLFLSATRDATFGPVLVIGLGGGNVELSGAVRFIPLSEATNDRIAAAVMAVTGRGSVTPSQLEQVTAIAASLITLVSEDVQVADVELNPVRITGTGEVVALDALVTLSDDMSVAEDLPVSFPFTSGILRGLSPRDVSIVGVSRGGGGNGNGLLRSLQETGYQGNVYIVHPSGVEFQGASTVTSFAEHDGSLDLVILSIAPAAFAQVLEELEHRDVGLIIAVTSLPEPGDPAHDSMNRAINSSRHAILGPNTAGLVSVPAMLRATAVRTAGMRPEQTDGTLALATQSGSIGSYLIGRAFEEQIGLRHWVPTGNELSVQLHDVVRAFALDPKVRVIGLFVEGVRNGPALLAAIDEARARGKFVAAYCIGRTEAGKSAAMSHTAAMSGNHAVLSDVLRSHGVLVVDDTVTLFDVLKLATQTFAGDWADPASTQEPTIIALSTSGGSCSIAAEEFDRRGRPLPALNTTVAAKLEEILPSYATVGNPTDVTFDAVMDASIFPAALRAIADTYPHDIMYFPFGTQAGPTAMETARQIIEIHDETPMRVLISRLGPATLWPEVVDTYRSHGIPVFDSPHTAIRALCLILDHLQALREQPTA